MESTGVIGFQVWSDALIEFKKKNNRTTIREKRKLKTTESSRKRRILLPIHERII